MKGRGYNMLTEDRHSNILSLLDKEGSVTVQQLMKELQTSESTIRRDLNQLDSQGFLTKVHGGAIAKNTIYSTMDENVMNRKALNADAKIKIAKYAASLIEPGDFVYLDAGTTTYQMLDYLGHTAGSVTYVTNGVQHASRLAAMGCKVYLPGGRLKANTQAVIGTEAIRSISNYNFTKGFFGTNGISKQSGLTTPDMNEAMVKKTAMGQCREVFVLADHSKFGNISSVTFGSFQNGTILTDTCPEEYKNSGNVVICG